jgi:hypothetical protein
VKVNRASAVTDSRGSADRAIKNLEKLMNGRSLETHGGGVTKLGYSWEAMDVRTFKNANVLSQQMVDLFFQNGCQVDSVLVQERVPNSFEIRFITVKDQIRHTVYTHFGSVSQDGLFRDFERTQERREAAQRWFNKDEEGIEKAEKIARECIAHWQLWFLTEIERTPPAIRFDFIVGRNKSGDLTVYLGELCELGFSIMGMRNAEHEIFPAIADTIGEDRFCGKPDCPLCCRSDEAPLE